MKISPDSALLTDLYELTMLQAYFMQRMDATAVFDFFVRKLPANRNFLMAAGLEQVVDYLTNLRFKLEDIAWLRESGKFSEAFIDSLRDFRFTGDVDAMPEGTIFFENEPILRITAPLREAQFVESRIMNLLHLQTLVASKATRCVLAAPGKRLIDFGMRRAHGAEAALLSARASYIAGFDGTATTLAGAQFCIPLFGTMAHSYIQAHEREMDAFASYARAFPDGPTLLIDTYDTDEGARQVVRLAHLLQTTDTSIAAVRIDSGDLEAVARTVRHILDAGNCRAINIIASGNLDEYALDALVRHHAPIDGFGVGTRMNTSADAPYLDCAYKMTEYDGKPRRKTSPGKISWPGRKQIFRMRNADGTLLRDTMGLEEETLPGERLLQKFLLNGKMVGPRQSLNDIRMHAREQLHSLPAKMKRLSSSETYEVTPSDALKDAARQADSHRKHLA